MIGKNTVDTAREVVRYVTARMNMSDRGATAVEYGLIVALIAAIIVVTVGLVGQDTLGGFEGVEDNVNGSQN